MSENAIVVATPKQSTDLLLQQANMVLQMKRLFKRDVHYGPPYPGSKKDTLLKPGAELLARRFGIYPHYELVKEVLQINPANLSESVIIYIYRCQMIDISSGVVVGEAIGACSSLEDKYRQRNDKLKCPNCGKDVLTKTSRNPNQYWCNKYKDGCGENFDVNDPAITGQEVGKVLNPNPLNELNTVIKMAQKRSMLSAVIVATSASSYFAPGDAEVNDAYAVNDDDDGDILEADFVVVTPGSFPEDQPAGQGVVTPTQRAQQQAAPQPAEKPATPKNATTPPAQPQPAPPGAYQIGDLYNAVLKDVYNNIPQHMNASIKKLIDAGALKPDMTLEMAIAAVKNRKTEDNKPVALPPSVTAAQKAAKPVFDGVTPPAPVPDDAALRRNTLARLEGEAVTLFRVEKAKYVQGQGKAEGWKWIGLAMITESDGMEHKVEVRLFPEDIDAISRAGHAFPRIDAAVNIDVILHIENDMIRINREKLAAKDTTPIAASPFGKGKFDPESQKMFESLPGISDAAKHQLEA